MLIWLTILFGWKLRSNFKLPWGCSLSPHVQVLDFILPAEKGLFINPFRVLVSFVMDSFFLCSEEWTYLSCNFTWY